MNIEFKYKYFIFSIYKPSRHQDLSQLLHAYWLLKDVVHAAFFCFFLVLHDILSRARDDFGLSDVGFANLGVLLCL